MPSLKAELDSNFDTFAKAWKKDLETGIKSLSANKTIYNDSYRRLSTLHGWRSYVLEPRLSTDALCFFIEAQNDALISHTQASMGGWRVALKSLRSMIENALCALYYMDHAIELQLWESGRHKLGFSSLIKYIEGHPEFLAVKASLTGIEIINKEYKELSKAVHGSSKKFRMTDEGQAVNLWNTDKVRLNQWQTREKLSLLGVNLLLLSMFKQHLQGTANTQVRQSLAFSIPKNKDSIIKKELGITIRRS